MLLSFFRNLQQLGEGIYQEDGHAAMRQATNDKDDNTATVEETIIKPINTREKRKIGIGEHPWFNYSRTQHDFFLLLHFSFWNRYLFRFFKSNTNNNTAIFAFFVS